MRLVLVNPHVRPYGNQVAGLLLKRKHVNKYSFFISEFINDPKKEVTFLVDGTRSSFNTLGGNLFIFGKIIVTLEVLLWQILNGINIFKHKICWSVKKLDPDNDIIFNFSKSSLDGYVSQKKINDYFEYDGLQAIHLGHYFLNTSEIAKNCEKIKNPLFVAEGNLCGNSYFKRYFSKVKSVVVMPFVVRERYKMIVPFEKRKNKCLATGSLVRIKNRDFNDFFGFNVLHPLRKILLENATRFPDKIDTFITEIDDLSRIREKVIDSHPALRPLIQITPFILLEKLFGQYSRKYFSFDIVKKYNEYMMCIGTDEITGALSVNTFEAMACGCALMAEESPIYDDLGLIEGVHYVGFTGGLEGLIKQITYYQGNLEKLKKIAENGRILVENKFTPQEVSKCFWADLEKELSILKQKRTV